MPNTIRLSEHVCDVIVLTSVAAGKFRFTYQIPEKLSNSLSVGSHVQVPFGRKQVDAIVVSIQPNTIGDHPRAKPVTKLLSRYPLISPVVLDFYAAVTDFYGHRLPDLLRLALPARHVRGERTFSEHHDDQVTPLYAHATNQDLRETWRSFPAIEAFVRHAIGGHKPLARWQYIPNWQNENTVGQAGWTAQLATLAALIASQNKDVILVMATNKQVNQLTAALEAIGLNKFDPTGQGASFAVLTSQQHAEERYQQHLAVVTGLSRIIVGTRSAVLAPVTDPALIVIFDELSEHHREQRTPYFHSRRVAMLRTQYQSCGLLFAGSSFSTDIVKEVCAGHIKDIPAAVDAQSLRPQVHVVSTDDEHRQLRVPPAVYSVIDDTLKRQDAVLIQVPSTGKYTVIRCANCFTNAHCQLCHGPLQFVGTPARSQCQWCAHLQVDWQCSQCQSTKLRSGLIGVVRSAEEFGRAFSGSPVITSASNSHRGIIEHLPKQRALVLATPGAEPLIEGGYGAVIVLDFNTTLDRPGLRSAESALGQAMRAAELAKSARLGGKVLVVGQVPTSLNNALVRWQPDLYLRSELQQRRDLYLPPHTRAITVTGIPGAVNDVLNAAQNIDGVKIFGPLTQPLRTSLGPPPGSKSQADREQLDAGDGLFDIEPSTSRGLITFVPPGDLVVKHISAMLQRMQLDKKRVNIQVEPWELLED